uniref:Uncharacterized protein n=3 Tax=Davidia involucrata TaxID=16924 RepID=A0A5B6Z411_DAVIN
MEISSPPDMPVSEDVNRFHDMVQLSLNQPQCSSDVMGDISPSGLGDSLTEFLRIQDDQKSASNSILFPPSDKNDTTNVENEGICEEPYRTKSTIVTSDKCLSKCATFSCSGETKPFSASPDGEDEEGEDEDELDEITVSVLKDNGYESAKPASPHPVSLPTPLKLVSAMKGSREKQGTPPKKLTVTWAPDVYDPPPSDFLHVATNKKQRHRSDSKKNSDSKKYGKNKQKGGGKPTRGKDKKQVRKSGGSSKCFKSFDDDDDPYSEVDFDVGSPDSYCGSSFLKKSVTKMHFPVAEA